ELAEEPPKERTAPDTDREQATEQNHSVDTRASLPGPVHVLEVEPECEFVERERGGPAVQHRREFRQCVVGTRCRPGVDLDEPEIARAEETGDAEDEVMEVPAAHG